ncbi:hypothetical protein D3C76_1619030 [compost metagenome]
MSCSLELEVGCRFKLLKIISDPFGAAGDFAAVSGAAQGYGRIRIFCDAEVRRRNFVLTAHITEYTAFPAAADIDHTGSRIRVRHFCCRNGRRKRG